MSDSLEPGHADPSSSTTPNNSSPPRTPAAAAVTPITYRLASPSDASAIAALIGRVWSQFFAWSVTPADLEHYLTVILSPDTIASEIASPSQRVLLAVAPSQSHESEGEGETAPPTLSDGTSLVGVSQLVLDASTSALPPLENSTGTEGRYVELQRLYVHERHHGSGLSRTLFERSEDLARGEGCSQLWLGAWENNKRGIRFYEKMGLKEVGEKTFIMGSAVRRDLVMLKAL